MAFVSIALLFISFGMIVLVIVFLGLAIALQCTSTTYDKETKILRYRRFGFLKTYDMNLYRAEPVYYRRRVMYIDIMDQDKLIRRIETTQDYKYRKALIYALCKEY